MKISFPNFYNPYLRAFNPKKEKKTFSYSNPSFSLPQQLSKDSVQISFQEKYMSVDNFQVKKLKNLRCPVCGRIMLDDEQMEKFIEDVESKRGKDLIQALSKYEDEEVFTHKNTKKNKSIYRPIKQQAVNIIKNLAKKYPEKSLLELFLIQKSESMQRLIPVQIKILEEFENYALSNAQDEEQKEQLQKLIEEYRSQIQGTSPTQFARKTFIYAAVHSFPNKKEQEEINEIVQKLPTSKNSVDAFFVKYATPQSSSYEMAKKLVLQTTSSTEHLQPKSKNGKNRLSNYIADCADCNLNRQNKDFDEWADSIPDFKGNLQEYLEDIQEALDNGLLDESYHSYIPAIIHTIKHLTQDDICLVLPDSNNPKTKEKTILQRKQQVEKIKEQIADKQSQKETLEATLQKIESTREYRICAQYKIALGEIDSIKKSIEELKLEIQKTRKDSCSSQSEPQKPTSKKTRQKRKKSKETTAQNEQTLKQDKELNLLNERLKQLEKKREFLESKVVKLPVIQAQIEELLNKISIVKKAQEEISSLIETIQQEPEITRKMEELASLLEQLEAKNGQILSNSTFNASDDSDYLEYLHVKDLINTARQIKYNESLSNRKSKAREEIFDIAIEALTEKGKRLSNSDSVIYFINFYQIESKRKQYDAYKKQLEAISKAKEKKEETIKKLDTLLQNKTIEQLKEEYAKLLQKKELLEKIEQIDILRTEWKNLEDTCIYNGEIYSRLLDYENMSNEEFRQLINQIY